MCSFNKRLTHLMFQNFQLLLSSQLAEFETSFRTSENGIERLADILEAVHDFAVDVVEVQHLLR